MVEWGALCPHRPSQTTTLIDALATEVQITGPLDTNHEPTLVSAQADHPVTQEARAVGGWPQSKCGRPSESAKR